VTSPSRDTAAEILGSALVAAGLSKQCAQPNVTHHPAYVIWQFRQVVDYLLSLDHVTFGAALQQSLRKAGCAPNTLHDLAAPEQLIDSLTHRRNSFAEVADAEALTCRTNLHRWQVDPEVLLL